MSDPEHPQTAPSFPPYLLSSGTLLYHGVRLNEDENPDDLYPADEIDLPAWFSRDPAVAHRFARGGPVRTYRLTEDLSVDQIRSRADLGALLEHHGIGHGAPEEILDGLPTDYRGWVIEHNYGPGSDDLLLGRPASIEVYAPPVGE